MEILTAVPNVSTPCVTTDPCTCPVYGPGGLYQPIQTETGPVCWLILETNSAPPPLVATPVPTLSEWAVLVTIAALAVAGWWRSR
jgi:hypothetical protein